MGDSNTYFDLPGLMNIQSKYLTDLSKNYYNNAVDVAINVNNLQKNLIDASNSYTNADKSSTAVLTDQKAVMKIVNDEQQRLNKKKDLILQAEQESKRKSLLNDTYRKRKVQYSKIMIVIIITLVFIIVLTVLSRFSIIPSFIITFLYILVISTSVIIIFNLYVDILSRDYINYDEIYMPPPPIDACGNLMGSSNIPSLWSTMQFGCYESACCSEGTVYDNKLKLCVSPNSLSTKSPSGITAPSSSYPNYSSYKNPGSSSPSSSPSISGSPSSSPSSSGSPSSNFLLSNPSPSQINASPSAQLQPGVLLTNNPTPSGSSPSNDSPSSSLLSSALLKLNISPFTTIDQAVQYGDLNETYKILTDSNKSNPYKTLQNTAKAYTDLEFTDYKYKK
jgi:hypothetical protein